MRTPWGNIDVIEGDHIAKMIKENGAYEEGLINTVLSNCSERRVFVDVGACYGTHSLAFGKYFREGHAFEPNSDVLPLLKKNVPKTVQVHDVALGHVRQKVGLNTNPKNVGNTNVNMMGDIPMETIDGYDLDEIDLMKIDVEGFEKAVLRGAKETIRRNEPVIVFEYRGQEKMMEKRKILNMDFDPLSYALLEVGYRRAVRLGGGNILLVP